MKYDNDDTPGQHSATELQPRRLVVPEPAAYATNKRLDVIHEPNLDLLSRGPQRAPRTPTSTTDWPGLQSFQQLNGDLAPDHRFTDKHQGRNRSGGARDRGLNDLVCVLYRLIVREYEPLHQANRNVLYSTGFGLLLPRTSRGRSRSHRVGGRWRHPHGADDPVTFSMTHDRLSLTVRLRAPAVRIYRRPAPSPSPED